MLKVVSYKGEDLVSGALIAISNRLYVPGWRLREELYDFSEGAFKDGEIAIAFLYDFPVAIATSDGEQVMAFCRKAYRHKGYASACLKSINTGICYAEEGIKNSHLFWDKHGIHVRGYLW